MSSTLEIPDSSVYAGTLELTVVSLLADKPPTFSRSRIILADVLALLWRVGVKVEMIPYSTDYSDQGVSISVLDTANEAEILTEETTSGSQAAPLICLAAWKLAHRKIDSTVAPVQLPELLEHLKKKLQVTSVQPS